MSHVVLPVRPHEAGHPLLEFLAHRLQLSKKKAKALLDTRAVLVNGQRVWMARHRLRPGDRIEVPAAFPRPSTRVPPILYQDDDYLIVNKPAGVLSVGPGSLESHLQAALKLPSLAAVHRLDRDTTGCLLFAKSPAARDAMVPLFAGHRVTKTYRAIVAGRVQPPRGQIGRPLDEQPAVTRYEVLESNELASYLNLVIPTGRTHQIRRHLAGLGHPVLGDTAYGAFARRHVSPRRSLVPDRIAAYLKAVSRQMLHARILAFHAPGDGRLVRAEAPLPTDFRACLRRLGLARRD